MTAGAEEVLVVGGGPVGLVAALDLARHGVPTTILERDAQPSTHPKARGIRVRATEVLRSLGLEPPLRAIETPGFNAQFIYCRSLAGEEIARTPGVRPPAFDVSPTRPLRVPQDRVEALLREEVARSPHIQLLPGHEVLGLTQDEDAVTVTVRTADGIHERTAPYVIGADGVASSVRGLIGASLEGDPCLAYWQSIYWHADIADLVQGRSCILFFTEGEQGLVAVGPVDMRTRWVSILTLPPSEERPAPPTPEESLRIVRRAVGVPDLAVEVVDTATWRVSASVADAYRVGRVFLAGDAAHTLPPTGGFGLNVGLPEAQNLAWKLAGVLQGRFPASLLETYEAERRPIAQRAVAWSVQNLQRFDAIREALLMKDEARMTELLADQVAHADAIREDIAFRYPSGWLAAEVSPPAGAEGAEEALQSAAPGRRVPHAWLADGVSTLDELAGRMTLVLGRDADAAADLPDIEVRRIGQAPLDQPDRDLHELLGIATTGALLVRPDQHVAWRSTAGVPGDLETLHDLLGAGVRHAP